MKDARNRAATVLDALRRDAASLTGDSRWAEGQGLYAETCDATERLLAELIVGAAAAGPSGEVPAGPSETPRP